MKKKVHIISHSHWDREWYLPYEQHHMRLIELIDDILEMIEKDPAFNSFHLDGQTIILDDYLQVRPEKKEALAKAIKDGKLKIGPFYILQDDFLISSESNTRNMLIGRKESEKWGQPTELGYFPDTFGNMGQTPQMMKLAGLNAAAYGRGVKPIGFDNEVLKDDNYTSQYSEMNWQGPDGSQILGILFANWYSNGNEIPATETEARKYWEQKLADVEKYASTRHLLMMNGVDHQPLQKDITKAIALANDLYPEYEFVHSNFNDYLAALEEEISDDMGTIEGELTSQETDGWFTLANTASARVYLKQWNTRVSRQLENLAEPLASMAYDVTGKYPHDQLDYAWKLLMQNHPHDSICGCSVDEVHREMMPRFEKANEVAKYVASEALAQITNEIDTKDFPEESKPFVVFNTAGIEKSGLTSVEVEVDRIYFKELYPSDGYEKLAQIPAKSYQIIDDKGQIVNASISDEKIKFDYELPKDGFRIPYMEKYVTVELEINKMPEFSWQTYALIESQEEEEKIFDGNLVKEDGHILENDFIKVEVAENGSLTILDKEENITLKNQLIFEDTGDIGNEYIYKQAAQDKAILSTDFPYQIEVIKNNTVEGRIRLTHLMEIPVSAEELLDLEQRMVVDFRYRKSQRSKEKIKFPISTEISINNLTKEVKFKTKIDNKAKDHRIRAIFPTGLDVESHEADSIYEVVTRPNKPSTHWENPTNPQHQHAFVNMHNDYYGLTISNFGLNEYEVVDNNIALTLIRSVGELGDWGYFATPEAQCQGEYSFDFGLQIHGKPEKRYDTYRQAQSNQYDFVSSILDLKEGSLPHKNQYLQVDGDRFAVTALKRGENNELVLRGYSMSDEESDLHVTKSEAQKLKSLNLLEEEIADFDEKLRAHEIRTISINYYS